MSQSRYKQWKDRTKKDRIEYALTRFTSVIQRQSQKLREQEKHNRILRIALWCLALLNVGWGLLIWQILKSR